MMNHPHSPADRRIQWIAGDPSRSGLVVGGQCRVESSLGAVRVAESQPEDSITRRGGLSVEQRNGLTGSPTQNQALAPRDEVIVFRHRTSCNWHLGRGEHTGTDTCLNETAARLSEVWVTASG